MHGAVVTNRSARPIARRLAMGSLVLALGVSVTTCRLDKLLNPATVDRLTVSPSTIVRSAHAGSDVDSLTLRVTTSDGGVRGWSATKSTVWLELSRYGGTTPDSVFVMIDPDTLAETPHQDTIVFVDSLTNDTIRVPVSLTVLPPSPELSVIPASRAETAYAGSAVPDTFSLIIDNTGALPLTWSAVVDSSWIAISKDSGGAPPAETSLVTLTPGSLPPGTHSGAITLTATPPGTVNSPATVPVTYVIRPCDEPLITLDTLLTGAIALSDCGAPQRAGNQAKVYALQANKDDTLSFRVTSTAFTPYLVLTNSSGVAVLDSLDQCAAVDTACLTNFIVSNTGRYLIEVTTASPGETGAFTLSAVRERTPSISAVGQFRTDGTTAIAVGAETPENTVVFKATLNDPNPQDSVRLEVELTDVTSGTQVDSSALVPRGTSVALSVSGLTENHAYYWRARACDKSGRCSPWFNFGGNVDPAADFFVNAVPEAPPIPTSIGQFTMSGAPIAEGGSAGGSTVTLSGTVDDPDPLDQVRLEVEAVTVPLSGNNFTNAATAVSAFGPRNRIASATGPATVLFSYHWQVRTCDQTGRCSAWVSFPQPTPNPETSADYVGSL